jgi:hypothetical protein
VNGGRSDIHPAITGAGKDARLVEDLDRQAALTTIHRLREQGLSYRAIAAAVEAENCCE